MRTKHTPGPWHTGDGTENNLLSDVFIGNQCIDAGSDADARLIAAAPELLEALENMIQMYMVLLNKTGGIDDSIAFSARQALAKARGES